MKIFNLIVFIGMITFANAQIIRQSSSVVKDTATQFLWQDSKAVSTEKRTFEEALSYCKNLDLEGIKNWELPNFMELFSLVDTKVYNPTLSKEFKHFVSDNYWTSKTFGHGVSGEAFVINFLSGAFNRELMEDKFYVRCYKKSDK